MQPIGTLVTGAPTVVGNPILGVSPLGGTQVMPGQRDSKGSITQQRSMLLATDVIRGERNISCESNGLSYGEYINQQGALDCSILKKPSTDIKQVLIDIRRHPDKSDS